MISPPALSPTVPVRGGAVKKDKELAAEGERTGVCVLIENHGGISSDADLIVRIIEEVGSPAVGTCPDFGNTPDHSRIPFLQRIMPYAKVVHIKFYQFDAAGEETRIDVRACLEVCRNAGFDGYLSIEFEGEGDQFEGVARSVALLRKYL